MFHWFKSYKTISTGLILSSCEVAPGRVWSCSLYSRLVSICFLIIWPLASPSLIKFLPVSPSHFSIDAGHPLLSFFS